LRLTGQALGSVLGGCQFCESSTVSRPPDRLWRAKA